MRNFFVVYRGGHKTKYYAYTTGPRRPIKDENIMLFINNVLLKSFL